jgi:HEAT repeat protein
MGMLHLSLVSLSLFLQDPEVGPGAVAQSPAVAVVTGLEAWLPEDAAATLLVSPFAESAALLADTPILRTWQDESFAAVRELLASGMEQIAVATGVPAATLLELAGNGCAVGIGDSDDGDRPELVIALVLGEAEATVRAASARWTTSGGLRSASGTPVLRLKGAPLYCGFLRGCLFVTSSLAQVDAAELRLAAAAGSTAGDAPTPPLVRFRLAFDRLWQIGERRLPSAMAPRVAAVANALGLAGSKTLELSLTVQESGLQLQAHCDLPGGGGLVPMLVGQPDMLLPVLAQAVPRGAQAFAAGGVDLGAAIAAMLECAQAIEPGAEQAIRAFTAVAAQRAKVDVQEDLLLAFAGGLVTAQWQENDATMFGMGARLQNAMRFQVALNGLLKLVPVRPEKVDCGVPALAFPSPSGSEARPTVAIVDDWLIVGSAPAAVAGFAKQIRAKAADPLVAKQLQQAPAGTTWVVWQSADALRSTAVAGGAALPEMLLEGLGPALTHVVLGDGSVGWRCDASMAGVQFLLALRQAVAQFTGAQLAATARNAPAEGSGRTAARTPPGRAGSAAGGKAGSADGGGAPGGGAATVDDPLATAAEVAVLEAAAKDPPGADLAALSALLSSASPKVAARAAWCLGQNRSKEALQILGSAALAHRETEVRRQALAAMIVHSDATTEAAAIEALGDAERSVRTLAAQLVGHSRSGDAVDMLVGMVREQCQVGATEPLTDVAAAVLAAHDLGDPQVLVPMATAAVTEDPLVGQALAFLFQGLSPKLPKSDEAEVMVAVLDHQASLLRRYAIQRLGELADPAAAKVLESRLATESKELQPLVRVALDRVRGQDLKPVDDLATRIRSNAAALAKMAEAHLLEVAGGLVALFLLVTWITLLRVRAARRHRGEEAAALAAPTEGFEEQQRLADEAAAEEQELVETGGRSR